MRTFTIEAVVLLLALAGCALPTAQQTSSLGDGPAPARLPFDRQVHFTAEEQRSLYDGCMKTTTSSLVSAPDYCSCMVRETPAYLTRDDFLRLITTGTDEAPHTGMMTMPSPKLRAIMAICVGQQIKS